MNSVDLREMEREEGHRAVNVTGFTVMNRRLMSSIDIDVNVLDSVILSLLQTWLKRATGLQKQRLRREVSAMIDGEHVDIEPELRVMAADIDTSAVR